MRRLWIGIGAGLLVGAAGMTIASTGLLAHRVPPRQSTATCRVPILLTRSKTAGFLHYPEKTFSTAAGVPSDAESYDAALGRWLPVPWYDIAPDGSYAYTIPPVSQQAASSEVHVATAGSDRVVWHGAGKAVLNGMDSRTVYFTVIGHPSSTYAVPALGGPPKQVYGGGVLGPDGGFWGEGVSQSVVRYDPQTGARTTWWSTSDTPGAIFANPASFDASHHPILFVAGMQGNGFVLMTAPHQAITLVAPGQLSDPEASSAVGDAHGIWIGRDDASVALWTSAHGLTEMLPPLASGRGDPALILGPCEPLMSPG